VRSSFAETSLRLTSKTKVLDLQTFADNEKLGLDFGLRPK